MTNPIDKDKVTEMPGLLPYAHTIGSAIIKPDDVGKIKSRALAMMYEQTNTQLMQIQKQAELLVKQANEIKQRVAISEKMYQAKLGFEPIIGQIYHLYKKESTYFVMMIAPTEWGKTKHKEYEFEASIKLLSDHTWMVI